MLTFKMYPSNKLIYWPLFHHHFFLKFVVVHPDNQSLKSGCPERKSSCHWRPDECYYELWLHVSICIFLCFFWGVVSRRESPEWFAFAFCPKLLVRWWGPMNDILHNQIHLNCLPFWGWGGGHWNFLILFLFLYRMWTWQTRPKTGNYSMSEG